MYKIILSLLLLSSSLKAAIFHEIDTTTTLCCAFSAKHHNRILVEEGRIKKIIFPEDKLFVRMEELSGQCFIQPKSPVFGETLISIVTQDGHIQDIELIFLDMPSEVVVLKMPTFEPEILYELKDTPGYCFDDSLNAHIETLLNGEIPNGYRSLPFKRCLLKPKLGISAKLVARLEGPCDELLLYEVSNRAWWKKRISEREIVCQRVNWVYLEKNCLKSKETILGIVSVKHE